MNYPIRPGQYSEVRIYWDLEVGSRVATKDAEPSPNMFQPYTLVLGFSIFIRLGVQRGLTGDFTGENTGEKMGLPVIF